MKYYKLTSDQRTEQSRINDELTSLFMERGHLHRDYRAADNAPVNLHIRVDMKTKISFQLDALDLAEFKLNKQLSAIFANAPENA